MNDSLVSDAAGYGDVVAAFQGDEIVHAGRVAARVKKLTPEIAETFVGSEYAQVVSRDISHLYRSFDSPTDDPLGGASPTAHFSEEFAAVRGSSMLGQVDGMWLTPMRPTFMEEFRRTTAVRHAWNRNDFVLDASLLAGATIYVGRAGSQRNVFRGRASVLAGGAMQVWLPRDQVPFLTRNTIWVVR